MGGNKLLSQSTSMVIFLMRMGWKSLFLDVLEVGPFYVTLVVCLNTTGPQSSCDFMRS